MKITRKYRHFCPSCDKENPIGRTFAISDFYSYRPFKCQHCGILFTVKLVNRLVPWALFSLFLIAGLFKGEIESLYGGFTFSLILVALLSVLVLLGCMEAININRTWRFAVTSKQRSHFLLFNMFVPATFIFAGLIYMVKA